MADRWNKKSLLLACDISSMFVVTVALALHHAGSLSVPFIAITILVLALASELRWSVLGATISVVVPKEHLGRMNGLQQSFRGITVMLGPVLGAVGFDALGLSLLLALDVLSYVVGIGGLLAITIGSTQHKGDDTPAFLSFWHELTYGFRWVFRHPSLRRLLIFFMIINLGVSTFTVTFTPYVLSFASNKSLGVGLGLQGAGSFLSGLILASRRKQVAQDAGIIWGAAGFGMCMFVWGISREIAIVWCVAFVLGVFVTIIAASSQTIWQTHVPVQIQGKVFAVRTVLSYGLAPVSILATVPLASTVFAPLLSASSGLRTVWGASLSGALGLMVSMFGVGVVASSVALIATGGLRLSVGNRFDAGRPVG